MGLQIMGCGTHQYSKTQKKGEFTCPRCEKAGKSARQPFKLETWKTWFTLFWIPIIPLSGFEQVTCKTCHGQFAPNALDA